MIGFWVLWISLLGNLYEICCYDEALACVDIVTLVEGAYGLDVDALWDLSLLACYRR